jgi:hypothetical protein
VSQPLQLAFAATQQQEQEQQVQAGWQSVAFSEKKPGGHTSGCAAAAAAVSMQPAAAVQYALVATARACPPVHHQALSLMCSQHCQEVQALGANLIQAAVQEPAATRKSKEKYTRQGSDAQRLACKRSCVPNCIPPALLYNIFAFNRTACRTLLAHIQKHNLLLS